MAEKLTMVAGNRYAGSYLTSGQVPIVGFDIDFGEQAGRAAGSAVARNELFDRLTHDIVEMPLSNYILARDRGIPIKGIAAFPSLFFPQAGAMVNKQAGIRGVDDLIGKRVGVNGFGYNPAAWLLGILFHQYDLPVEKIIWVEDLLNSVSSLPFGRSRRFTIEQAEGLLSLLEEGRIQAVFFPGGGSKPSATVDRLFPDYLAEIRRYAEATGIFPINTVITIREETLSRNPGLDESLTDAYREGWRRYEEEAPADSLHQGLPVGELRAMGLFPRPDGFNANRNAIRMLVHYCYEQGLIRTLLEPEDLFTATG